MKRYIVPVLLSIVLSVVLVIGFLNVDLTPSLASREGGRIDTLLQALFIIAAIAFSVVISFMLYSFVAFRRRPGDLEDADPVHGNLTLEIVWTVIPLILVLSLAGYATAILLDIKGVSAQDELVVDVVGVQFAWSFHYPEYDITSSILVLPVDQPAVFQIQSIDVIHSFWVPEFRIKLDAIPGILNEARVTPTETGEYIARCSELCGTGHAYMTAPVRVVTAGEFDEWVAEQQALAEMPAGGAGEGELIARQTGCLGCHSVDGSVLVGPTFQGLFGSRRTFEDGTAAIADEDYVRESILNPEAKIVDGFANMMPATYEDQLTAEQVNAIIGFIEGLSE